MPEPLLSTAGSCSSPAVQHPGQPAPTPLRAPWQAGSGGRSPPGVCWGHPGPAGSLCPSASTGRGCRYSAGPGIAGHCAGCQGGRPGLPIPPCGPGDDTACGGAGGAGPTVHHSALQPGPLKVLLCPSPACQSPLWGLGQESSVLKPGMVRTSLPFLSSQPLTEMSLPPPPTAFCTSHFV